MFTSRLFVLALCWFVFNNCILYAQNNNIYLNIEDKLKREDTLTAIQLHTQFTSINEIVQNKDVLIESINNLARINLYLKKKKFEKSDSLLINCKKCSNFSNIYFRTYYYRYEGLLNYQLKNYDKALKSFLEGCSLFKVAKDTLNAIRLLKNIGVIYMHQSNFILAEKNYNELYILSLKRKYNDGIQLSLKNLGAIYLHNEEIEKSLDTYLKVKEEYKLNEKDKALVFHNLGSLYLKKENYINAKVYTDSSLIYNQKLGDQERIVNDKINLSKIAIYNKQYNYAERLLKECISFYPDSGEWNEKIPVYYNFVELYSKKNQIDSIMKYVKLYSQSRDNARDEENQRTLLELSTKYETAQKDQEIALLQKQEEVNVLQLKKHKVMIVLIALFAMFIAGVALLINRHRHRLSLAKKALQEKQKELENNQQILYKTNEDLKLSGMAKDRILSVIGHDLRGPVGGLSSIIELYMDMPNLDEEDVRELLKNAFESSSSTYLLLENLLTWANSQRGVISFHPQSLPVYPIINQMVQLIKKSLNNQNINFTIDVNAKLKAYVDIDMLKSILRNLITNSIKFSDDGSTITVSAKEEKGSVLFCVQDEGSGMEASVAEGLFSKKEAFYLESSNTGKGTGLGLILCKEFVERHGGTIWVESQMGVGSCFYFSIPDKGSDED